jgi:hypothetical protein
MDVATLTEPAEVARAKYDEYRAALDGTEPNPEDKAILMGYAALAAGKVLIDLPAVFRACPVDEQGRPKLAAARAHWRWCHLHRGCRRDCPPRFTRDDYPSWFGRTAWHRVLDMPLPRAALPPDGDYRDPRGKTIRALVPLIPPSIRPTRALSRFVILFEPEWEPVPPADPMLLRHLHGGLYVVLSAWNLSPLERAVLAGRLTEPTR